MSRRTRSWNPFTGPAWTSSHSSSTAAIAIQAPSAQAQMQYKSAATTEFATVLGLLYEEHRAREGGDQPFHALDAVEVEVVGRLI